MDTICQVDIWSMFMRAAKTHYLCLAFVALKTYFWKLLVIIVYYVCVCVCVGGGGGGGGGRPMGQLIIKLVWT